MSGSFDWLFVGLGNPGEKYSLTRHNVGWMAAEKFAQKYNGKFKASWIYYSCEIKIGKNSVLLLLPTTYMNSSGEAVKKVKDKYSIPAEKIVALVDEYNFPVGKLHLKAGGSSGGHNGIYSLIQLLEDENFLRLRLGIDRKFGPGGLVDYVLSPFPPEEQPVLNTMLDNTVHALEYLIGHGAAKAASEINSGRLFNKD